MEAKQIEMFGSHGIRRVQYVPRYHLGLVREGSVKLEDYPVTSSPAAVAQVFTSYVGDSDREHLVAAALDTKNRVIGVWTVSIGSINAITIRAADVFKGAVFLNATVIMVGHNHPSGDPTPSPEDVATMRELIAGGKLLDIEVLDCLVFTADPSRYVSFRERGLAQYGN